MWSLASSSLAARLRVMRAHLSEVYGEAPVRNIMAAPELMLIIDPFFWDLIMGITSFMAISGPRTSSSKSLR